MTAVFYLLGSILVSCMNDVLIKYIGTSVPSVEIVFFRFLSSFLMLAIHLRLKYGACQIMSGISYPNFIRSLLGAISFYMYTYSILNIKLVTVTTIMWSVPLFVIILSWLLLKEKVHSKVWIATLTGFFGVIITMFDDISLKADFKVICFIPLVAALLFALQDIIIKQITNARKNELVMIMHFSLIISLLTAIPTFLNWVNPSPFEIFILFLVGILNNVMQYLLFSAYKRCDLSALASIKYTEFLFQLFFGYIFFSEIPEKTVMIGVAIIILSTYITVSDEKKHKVKERCKQK